MKELGRNRERKVVIGVCWGHDIWCRWWTWRRVVVCTMIIEGLERGKKVLGLQGHGRA